MLLFYVRGTDIIHVGTKKVGFYDREDIKKKLPTHANAITQWTPGQAESLAFGSNSTSQPTCRLWCTKDDTHVPWYS